MNSKKSAGKAPPAAAAGTNSSPKGKSIDQLRHQVADISIDAVQDGEWEVPKTKNRSGTNAAAKAWGSPNSAPKSRAHLENPQKQGMATNGGAGKVAGNSSHAQTKNAGRGNAKLQSFNRGWETAYMAPLPAVPPPLQHGWQWAARPTVSQPKMSEDAQIKTDATSKLVPEGSNGGEDSASETGVHDPDGGSEDDDLLEDSDDDILSDDDSDISQQSHETRKNGKWFRAFFEALDNLTIEQLNEPSRQWHCPACHDGPGAIDWYRGLQPLMTHAKTKGAKRVKLHRELAELLDEELQRRGTSVIPAGEAFGKWKGLSETTTDHEIVWPPMVVVMNTLLEQDDNEKWIGMGNPELLEYFSPYAAVKARHSYGPQGHRGMSVLIFESSAIGYLEAERLHKHFAEQGTDRDAWDRRRVLYRAGGKRQLYGYLATKDDMTSFNFHSQGKSKLKFEMRSYQEMVVGPMKQMSEDNQQLIWLKNRVAKEQQQSKALKQTVGVMSEKLRKTVEENRIVRLRTKIQHEENKEEMDYQEKFFKEQIAVIHATLEEKERQFETHLQEEREKAKLASADSGTKEGRKVRREEMDKFISTQMKGIKEFEEEREQLIREHEEKKAELRRRHLQEEVELEKKFDADLTQLMDRHAPSTSGET
eukprot:TRINITY_DN12315_c0_g1_i1.p1 TRINITY_DN12315_c0_g1~~TRINITY_DN12315_c0_g1_i1.p1  ORF type:complete len:648 (+),score=151.23 TRINITY_DN12315_c0_g1_i1:162-2105(+)